MNARAKRRLEIARALLKLDAGLSAEQVLTLIRAKERAEQDSLRSAVDWVEDYEGVSVRWAA